MIEIWSIVPTSLVANLFMHSLPGINLLYLFYTEGVLASAIITFVSCIAIGPGLLTHMQLPQQKLIRRYIK